MTTVYVLVGQTDYEGDSVLGVYESREAAEIAYQQYCQYCVDHRAFDDHNVYPVELGASAEWRY